MADDPTPQPESAPPPPSVQLFNTESKRIVPVPADSVSAAYASGKYHIPLLDPKGNISAASPEDARGLLAQGYKQPSNSELASHQQHLDALDEASEHPIQAGLESAARAAVPGGGAILSHIAPESESPEKQSLREEANPTASTIGSIGGTGAQLLATTLATGGLGDVAELGQGASMLGRLGRAGIIGATQGLTGGMSEADLGNTPYNAESLALDAGIGGVLGVGADAALALGETAVPKAISAAKRALGSLEDRAGSAFDKAVASAANNPEVDVAALSKAARQEAIAGGEAGAPITKTGKLAAAKELNESAADMADAVQGSLDKVADLHEQLWDKSRPEEIKQLALGHDMQNGGFVKAQTAIRDLVGESDLGANGGTGLSGALDEIGNAGYNWKAPQIAARKAVEGLGSALEDAQTSGDVYQALIKARQTVQNGLKYGKGLASADEQAVASEITQKVLRPMQDMLGRYGENGLTPESVAAFGPAQAERNAVINDAYSKVSSSRANLMKRLGFTDLGENGRPETNIKASKILSLIKGEGAEGELPTNLSQQEAKAALTDYLEHAKNYADVAADSAKTARQAIPAASEVKSLLEDVQTQRASAQDALKPTATQALADATSMTGAGAGGIRGAMANMGNAHALGIGAALTGHPLVGAAVEGAQRAFNAVKYPVETIRAYAQIRQAAAKAAGFVSSATKAFLGSEAKTGAEGALAGAASRSYADSQAAFAKMQQHLMNLGGNPAAAANKFAENTAGIGQVAPQHGAGVVGVAQRAQQVLIDAMPKNPNPSPLGPGQDHWQPNPTQLLQYEQIQTAVMQPKTVPQALAAGKLTPQAWAAFAQVYPQIAQDLAHQSLTHISEHPDIQLTMTQKLGLSMMTGKPVSPEVTPDQISFQQQQFATPQQAQPPGAGGAKMRSKGLDKLHVSEDTATPSQSRQIDSKS